MKILIATNHSYMFYRFRKELVEASMQRSPMACRSSSCPTKGVLRMTAAASTPSRI